MSVCPWKINVYSDPCFKGKTLHLKTNNWRIYWLVCGVVLLAVKTLSRDRKLTIAMCPVAYAFITREKYHRVCTQKKKVGLSRSRNSVIMEIIWNKETNVGTTDQVTEFKSVVTDTTQHRCSSMDLRAIKWCIFCLTASGQIGTSKRTTWHICGLTILETKLQYFVWIARIWMADPWTWLFLVHWW